MEGGEEKECNFMDKMSARFILSDSLRDFTCSVSLKGIFFSNL